MLNCEWRFVLYFPFNSIKVQSLSAVKDRRKLSPFAIIIIILIVIVMIVVHSIFLYASSHCFRIKYKMETTMVHTFWCKHSIFVIVWKIENAWNNEEIKFSFPNVRDVIFISMNEKIKSNTIFTKNLISSCTVYVLFSHHIFRSENPHIVWWRAFSGWFEVLGKTVL